MKSSLYRWLLAAACVFAACGTASPQAFVHALPGYQYEFPRDHFNHPDYQTEWWYYTGNLRAKDGHRFGFELTFFREGNTRGLDTSPWALHDLYMAHLAVSDVSGKQYYSTERLNRAGPGIAGIDAAEQTVWNGNWQTTIAPDTHRLRGIADHFSLDLRAVPQKGPVIHGENGVSQKSADNASHYISFTRMATTGTLQLNGRQFAVEGDAWMDHEFFTNAPASEEKPGTAARGAATVGPEVGWDWLSLQLADDTELMLYRLRHKDGSVDPYSSGSYIDRQGKVTHLALSDFTMTSTGTPWKSGATAAAYPLSWTVAVPRLQLQLQITTPLANQEFVSRFGPSYWEGAIDITGQRAGAAVHGTGYLEMTGYAGRAKPLVSR